MATRKKPVKKEKTLLIKPKSLFEKELAERIAIGAEITKDRIDNDELFGIARKEFSEWSDYNLELLKQSFSEPYNEYWRSYDSSDSGVGLLAAIGGRRQPGQALTDFLQRVELKLDNLNKLKNKVSLIESSVEDSEPSKFIATEMNMHKYS